MQRAEQTAETKPYHTRGSGNESPATWQFLQFSGKNSQFSAIWNTFHTFLEPFEKTAVNH